MSNIIERFLEFARPPKLQLQTMDLMEVIRKAATLVESEAKERNVVIHVQADEPLVLMVDGQQMEQVILNLLQNSLHATPSGGKIEMRLYRKNDEVLVEVAIVPKRPPLQRKDCEC